jgi:hypothetical protein
MTGHRSRSPIRKDERDGRLPQGQRCAPINGFTLYTNWSTQPPAIPDEVEKMHEWRARLPNTAAASDAQG